MEDARKIPPLQLRCPDELNEYLRNQAKQNRRSLNSELIMRLELTRQLDLAAQRAN